MLIIIVQGRTLFKRNPRYTIFRVFAMSNVSSLLNMFNIRSWSFQFYISFQESLIPPSTEIV